MLSFLCTRVVEQGLDGARAPPAAGFIAVAVLIVLFRQNLVRVATSCRDPAEKSAWAGASASVKPRWVWSNRDIDFDDPVQQLLASGGHSHLHAAQGEQCSGPHLLPAAFDQALAADKFAIRSSRQRFARRALRVMADPAFCVVFAPDHLLCMVSGVTLRLTQCHCPEEQTMVFKRLLVPVDGTELSDKAIHGSIALAAQLGASIVAFVAEPLPPLPSGPRSRGAIAEDQLNYEAKAIAHARPLLARFQAAALAAHVPFEGVFDQVPQVDKAIVAAAESHACDMIVMVTHGRGAFGEFLFGSQTKAVLAGSKLPLLVLH